MKIVEQPFEGFPVCSKVLTVAEIGDELLANFTIRFHSRIVSKGPLYPHVFARKYASTACANAT
jgi:hypothetical protein